MITYQLSRFKEYQVGIKAQDLKLLLQINNFRQEKTNEHQYIKQIQSDSKKQNTSNNTSPKKLKDHILSPTTKLMKEWDNLGEEEKKVPADITVDKGGHKNLKPSLKNRPIIELQSLEKESNKEDSKFKKLEYKSQFTQRNQIKRITNLLIQSRQEMHDSRENSAMKLITQSAQRREKKSITLEKVMSPSSVTLYQKPITNSAFKLNPNGSSNVEGYINSGGSHNSHFERKKIRIQKDTILIPKEQTKEHIEKTAEKTAEKEKEKEKAPEKKNTISYDEFLGSSVDFDQLFFKKTVNLGNKKVDEFYEVMEENPTFKTNETTTANTGIAKSNFDNKKMSTLSITKYRTLNNDFEDMAQTDFAIERILIKFSKIWLHFPYPQNRETVEEYKEDIFFDNILFSKGNLFLYSFFNLAVCLLWLLIHDDIDGFNGFFSTRIVVLSLALICAKFWTKDFPKKYHKGIILWFYGFTAIQILLFTIINPQIQIAMEIEFLACYVSLTRYAFITFIDSVIISVIFLVLHIIYLNIITVPAFLMLHSTFVVIFFNLVVVHIQQKTQIDDFNNSRINVIKKKQLNNLIVNLLPKHVYKAIFKF